MKVSAFDTGGTTGVAAWQDGIIWSRNVPAAEVYDEMEMLIPKSDLVILEQLTITAVSYKKKDLKFAIELAGVVKYLSSRAGVELYEQLPVDAMRFATDEKLKRIGWYVPGPDHQRDARRHILARLAELGLLDLGTLLNG